MSAAHALARALYGMTLPLVWRDRQRAAQKLEGFAATEAGSALDMLKAAELVDDPKLRRLFFRHAMDEARHARLFRAEARRLAVDAARLGSSTYDRARAVRQDLFARLGLIRFVAFVYLSERRGELQFQALERHFRRRNWHELSDLFASIRKDERFHVSYSHDLLRRFRDAGQGRAVGAALAREAFGRALSAWRRAGRIVGDLLGRGVLGAIYLCLCWPFALLARSLDPPRTGWSRRRPFPVAPATIATARRQR